MQRTLDLVQDAAPLLLLVYVGLIASAASANMVALLFLHPHCRLRDHVRVMRRMGSFDGLSSNIARPTTARRIQSIALVAFTTFTHNAAIGVGRVVGTDIGRAWRGNVSLGDRRERNMRGLLTSATMRYWCARHSCLDFVRVDGSVQIS
jgi:hypothetical protein